MLTLTLTPALAQALAAPTQIELDVSSVAEAIAALRANFPRWVAVLNSAIESGTQFRFTLGHGDVGADQLHSPVAPKIRSLRIDLVPAGSGTVGRIVAGVALIGLGLFSGGVGFLGLSGTTSVLLGASLILGAIFGQKKTPKNSDKDAAKSVGFGSPTQTVQAGGRMPVVYGVALTSWTVVSAQMVSYVS